MNMRLIQAAAAERSRPRRKQPVRVKAPIRGVMSRGEHAETDSSYAAVATNLISDGVEVTCRPGWEAAAGFPSSCLQAWKYEFGGTPQAVFRTSTGLASDDGGTTAAISYSGDIVAAEISNNLAFVGGGAAPRLWNGTAFSTPTWTFDSVSYVDDFTDMTGICTHHDRIFLWNENSSELGFYYAEQVAGLTPVAFTNFPLYALGNIEGRVKAMVSLSIDAGHGANDVLAIFTSTGQIVVYEGLDPSDPNDWRIWGRVPGTSNLVSVNAVVQVGTDALVTTQGGVFSARALLSLGAQATFEPPSDAIDPEIRSVVETGKAWRGWQMIHDPKNRFMILNYPTASDSYSQWVFVYKAKGWFKWTLPARWWFARDDELYFIHTDGSVKLFGSVGDNGAAITMTWWPNWIRLAYEEVNIKEMKVDLLAKSAISLSVTCLSRHRATSAAISENAQTIARNPQDTAGSDFQDFDEVIFLDQYGETVQPRLSLSATEATWLGATLFL